MASLQVQAREEELQSSTESDVDLDFDTSDDQATQLTLQRLKFQSDSEQEGSNKPRKWWSFGRSKTSYQPLSVQSGDITRNSPNTATASTDQENNTVLELEGNNLKCCSNVKKVLSIIFNWILKLVFFHRRVPIVPIVLLAINVIVCIVLLWAAVKVYPPAVNISLRSFTIPSHPSQEHWDVFLAAKAKRFINSTTTITSPDTSARQRRDLGRLVRRAADDECIDDPGVNHQTIPMHKYSTWNLELVYQVPDSIPDKNLLTKQRLSQIHEIEQSIYNSDDYVNMCHKSSRGALCDRLTSVVTSLYPTNSDGSYVYSTDDGFTPDLTKSLQQFKENPEQAYWFTGGRFSIVNGTNQIKATLLRSQVRVGLPLPCFGYGEYGEQKTKVYDHFISLIPLLEEASTNEVEVLYGGTAVFDYQVDSAKIHDALLVIPSLVLILVVMFILTGFSIWLTLAGIYAVASCFPWAFFVYRIVLDIETIGILNIISLFVVIGIGVDDVFVFINTFKQTARLKNLVSIHQRLGYTILTAGKSTLFTSLTTSVAFFANAVSSIPAVRQFGIFMGLIVIFCYIQVLLVLPLSLHIWHCAFIHCENFIYWPITRLCRRKSRQPSHLPVRMTELTDNDSDSGIGILDMENGNETESSSTSSFDSNGSETVVLIPRTECGASPIPIHDVSAPKPSSPIPLHNDSPTVHGTITSTSKREDTSHTNKEPAHFSTQTLEPVAQSSSSTDSHRNKETVAEMGLTMLLQVVILKCIARPILFFHTWRHNSRQPQSLSTRSFRWMLRQTCVLVYVLALFCSFLTVVLNLGFTDHPPQLFNPNTNIQKMLDLAGNLSDSGVLACSVGCDGGLVPYIPPPPSNPTTKPPPSTHSHSTTQLPLTTQHIVTTTHSHDSTTSSPQTPPPIIHTSPPQTPPPTTHPTTHATTTPLTTSGGSHTTTSGSHTVSPTSGSEGNEFDFVSSRVSNNIIVNVVFGVKDIIRKSNSSHVLPEGTEGDYAVEEDSFYGNLTCNYRPNKIDLTGSVRALCRICTNISNPANGLIMEGNFNCFPTSLRVFSCLLSIAVSLPECHAAIAPDTHNVSVVAESSEYYDSTDRSTSLQYLAMAFRSRTNPNDSPFESLKDYRQWEKFLSDELDSIKRESGQGELYEGADQLLLSGFQTSEEWYKVNLEIIAIYGSLYGIIVSCLLCVLVIVFFTHNWRIVLAILLTILNIIVTMLGFFVAFGWTIGIVEAITLSIVVGNSLDYCIHLTEGYMTADSRHLDFIEQFKFMSGASIRVKRVAASISFIGVSIFSSAITTILAVIPLLATQIELFTRFGQILLLDTVLAILYTFVFCGTFLALFGPLDNKFSKWKVVNAVSTVLTTFMVYVGLILLLLVLAKAGTPILTPEGNPLFT